MGDKSLLFVILQSQHNNNDMDKRNKKNFQNCVLIDLTSLDTTYIIT